MDPSLRELINDYTNAVARVVQRLQSEFGADRIRAGPVGGGFPRRGTLTTGDEYQFHGIGCSVECDGIDVFFDFGDDGRYDGFAAHHLSYFAAQCPGRYAPITEYELKCAIEAAVTEASLVRSGRVDDYLVYLTGGSERRL